MKVKVRKRRQLKIKDCLGFYVLRTEHTRQRLVHINVDHVNLEGEPEGDPGQSGQEVENPEGQELENPESGREVENPEGQEQENPEGQERQEVENLDEEKNGDMEEDELNSAIQSAFKQILQFPPVEPVENDQYE